MLQLKKTLPAPDLHTQAFVERYAMLLRWALHLTEHNREQAEDLLHDAFIQFTVARPDLAAIRNLDNYLFGVLRILRISQLRRAARQPVEPLPLFEYDSAELGLRTLGPGELLAVRDELRAICRYACARKESSKAGSVLILRFFHGYYPSEIARLLRSTRKVVDMRLQAARREARLYLAQPERLSFIKAELGSELGPERGLPKERRPEMPVRTADDLLQELRAEIFRARPGACPAPVEWQRRYQADAGEALETDELSHLVSCPQCLETVNQILGLPALAERFPTDTLDRNVRGGDDSGGGQPPASGGGGLLRQTQRRAQELFEHRPQELRVAVNGLVIATQKVHAESNELTLELNDVEPVEFIEVFSEQGLRLLLLPLATALGETATKTACAALSDGRSLELTLSGRAEQPTLHVIYCDPLFETASDAGEEFESKKRPRHTVAEAGNRFAWARWFNWEWRPAFVALLLATVVALSWLLRSTPTRVSAAELLQKSVDKEAQIAAPSQVIHRKFAFEERDPATQRLLAQRRIEVWQSAARRLTVRKLYDEQNKLLAGEWRPTAGASKLYQRVTQPVEPLWRYSLATPDFTALAAQAETTVEEQADAYLINYRFHATGMPLNDTRLLSASLTINKADYRARAQRLLVRVEQTTKEYRLTESSFAQLAESEVPDAVFQPEPELVGANTRVVDTKATENSAAAAEASASVQPQVSATVLAALEIEARYLLDQVNANLGEQVSVNRSKGQLQVRALVETERRKQELLAALAPLRTQPAVSLEIATYAEAAQRQPPTPAASILVSSAEITQHQIPAAEDLRRYFAAQATQQALAGPTADAWIENQIAQFANRAQSNAARPLRHAWALKRLVEQVSPAELQTLAPDAQAKWRKLVVTHAAAIQRETARLRAELQPIFFPDARDVAEPQAFSESDLPRVVEQLVQLTAEHDESVSRAFSKSAGGSAGSPNLVIKSAQFGQALRRVERLAASIVKEQ